MPVPFTGLVAVAEFGSAFEADVAVGALGDAGIDAVASSDPALRSVAGYLASDRSVDVLVREADVDRARAVLAARRQVLPEAFRDQALGDWPPTNRVRGWTRTGIVAALITVLAVMVVAGMLSALR